MDEEIEIEGGLMDGAGVAGEWWAGLALSRLVYSSLWAIVAHLPSPISCKLIYNPIFPIFATYA